MIVCYQNKSYSIDPTWWGDRGEFAWYFTSYDYPGLQLQLWQHMGKKAHWIPVSIKMECEVVKYFNRITDTSEYVAAIKSLTQEEHDSLLTMIRISK